MTTTQLVTFVKDKFAQDWSRASVLDLLNTIQHILCDHDCEQMLFTCDNGDFPVPYLKTGTGKIEYEIANANLSNNITLNGYATSCRRVKDVFIKIDSPYNVDYQRQYRRETFQYSNVNPWYTKSLSHITFEKVPARFTDKRGIQNAKIIFPEDPKTYNDKYLIEFWMNPIELSSESIQMSLNTSEFFDVLLDGVVGLIEQSEHGVSERWVRFMDAGCKKFWGNTNKGNENRPLQITRNEC
jgi:hypothetical protein